MKKIVIIILVLYISVGFVFSQEVKHFIYYSKIYDLESNSQKVFCASNNGILLYDKLDNEFQNYGEKDENLSGEKVYAVLKNENTRAILAFSNKGVYVLITGKYWEKIHKSIGNIRSYAVQNKLLFVKNENNRTYVYSDKALEFNRRNEINMNFRSIHKKKKRYRFPRNSFKIPDPIKVIDYEKIDHRKYVIFTKSGYLLIYNDIRNQYIINHGSVFDSKITNIFKSQNRMFFLGNRINILENQKFKFINIPQLKDNINDICNYKENSILIATKSNGIFKWKSSELKSKYMVKDGLLSNNILQIINDDKLIFALSKYGISIINDYTNEITNIKGIDYFKVNTMIYDKSRLVLQKKDGVIIRNMKTEKEIKISSNDLLNDILTDIEIVKNELFVSGNLGISKYDLNSGKIQNVVNFSKKINDILFYNKQIYIASDDGLYFYNLKESNITEFRENSELASLKVLKIINAEDKIFLKTSKGIDIII